MSLVRGDVGYRVGIHMKGYQEKQPVIVVGGTAGDFFGEYMAGGCLVLLNCTGDGESASVGRYCATGMHGGVMYIRGHVEDYQLGQEVARQNLEKSDIDFLRPILDDFAATFDVDNPLKNPSEFIKIAPVSARPYGQLYVY